MNSALGFEALDESTDELEAVTILSERQDNRSLSFDQFQDLVHTNVRHMYLVHLPLSIHSVGYKQGKLLVAYLVEAFFCRLLSCLRSNEMSQLLVKYRVCLLHDLDASLDELSV